MGENKELAPDAAIECYVAVVVMATAGGHRAARALCLASGSHWQYSHSRSEVVEREIEKEREREIEKERKRERESRN